MITQERVLELYRGANPVQDVESLMARDGAASYLETLEQRSREVTQLKETKNVDGDATKATRTLRPRLVALASVILLGVALVLVVQQRSSQTADAVTPIEAYIDAYNAGDIEGIMGLFTENAVIRNHPLNFYAEGLDQIRDLQIEDLEAATSENAYTIKNITVDGDVVTWDHIWISRDGTKSCRVGHEAVIEDGRIAYWTWPEQGFACP